MAFVVSEDENYRYLTGTAGVNPGVDLSMYLPAAPKKLRVLGALAVSQNTGARFGTAGVGTTSTTLNKPAGATDWATNALRDASVYVRVVAGGGLSTDGSPVTRPVKSNSTTAIVLEGPIPGMDATTRFQLVTLATHVDQISSSNKVGIHVPSCHIPVEIFNLDFTNANSLDSLIKVNDSTSAYIESCNIAYNTANPAIDGARSSDIEVNHCLLTNSGDVQVQTTFDFSSVGCINRAGGAIVVQDCLRSSVTKLFADVAPSSVLQMIHVMSGEAEVDASNGAATPVYLESVTTFSAVGGALQGSGNTGYGVEIEKSGQVTLTGSAITGSLGDVLFMSIWPTTWANLSDPSYGIVEEHAAAAIGNSAYSKSLNKSSIVFQNQIEFAARVLVDGIWNNSWQGSLVATGSTKDDAFQLTQFYLNRFNTVAAGTGCRLPLVGVVALPAVEVVISNKGANALKIYPPAGGTVNGAGTDVAYSLAAGGLVKLIVTTDDCLTWEIE